MKVAIDVRTVLSNRSGVGNYVLHLIQNLKQVDPKTIYYFLALKKNLSFLGPLAREQNPLLTVFSEHSMTRPVPSIITAPLSASFSGVTSVIETKAFFSW